MWRLGDLRGKQRHRSLGLSGHREDLPDDFALAALLIEAALSGNHQICCGNFLTQLCQFSQKLETAANLSTPRAQTIRDAAGRADAGLVRVSAELISDQAQSLVKICNLFYGCPLLWRKDGRSTRRPEQWRPNIRQKHCTAGGRGSSTECLEHGHPTIGGCRTTQTDQQPGHPSVKHVRDDLTEPARSCTHRIEFAHQRQARHLRQLNDASPIGQFKPLAGGGLAVWAGNHPDAMPDAPRHRSVNGVKGAFTTVSLRNEHELILWAHRLPPLGDCLRNLARCG